MADPPKMAVNFVNSGRCLCRSPMRAMAASWNAKPKERKTKSNACTTGKTARDSTGAGERPMKKVSMGCTVSPMSEVSARG
jgi:hypothetical protein